MSKYVRMTVYLESEQIRRLKEIARRDGCSLSALVRRIIRKHLPSGTSQTT